MTLSQKQLERYNRQIQLPEIGITGQKKLLAGHVLVIGLGGLGSVASLYLTASGIGTIGLVDYDTVNLSNLQRQILYSTTDLQTSKVSSSKKKLQNLNPINIQTYPIKITEDTLRPIIKDYDIILDATDNFETKFMINDVCVKTHTPFIHAGVQGFRGQILTYIPNHTCYRCIFQEAPSIEVNKGILGSTAGIVGIIQATEAIKSIANIGHPLIDEILEINLLSMQFRKIPVQQNPNCPICFNTDKAEI